jgi:hypothetical protein
VPSEFAYRGSLNVRLEHRVKAIARHELSDGLNPGYVGILLDKVELLNPGRLFSSHE